MTIDGRTSDVYRCLFQLPKSLSAAQQALVDVSTSTGKKNLLNKNKLMIGVVEPSYWITDIIKTHHYLRSAVAGVYNFGVFHFRNEKYKKSYLEKKPPTSNWNSYPLLAGGLIFGNQISRSLHKSIGPFVTKQSDLLELTRMFIASNFFSMGFNTESFVLGESLRRINSENKYQVAVSFADPYSEHSGTIYRTSNWLLNMPGKLFSDMYTFSLDGIKWISPQSLSRTQIPTNLEGLIKYCKLNHKGKSVTIRRICNKLRYVYVFGKNKMEKEDKKKKLKHPVLKNNQIKDLMEHFEENKYEETFQF